MSLMSTSDSDSDSSVHGLAQSDFIEVPQLDPESDVEISNNLPGKDVIDYQVHDSDGQVSEYDSDDDIPLADFRPLADLTRWTSRINPSLINNFTGQFGLDIGDGPFSYLDFFYMMFSEDFFQTIADETNRYARQSIQKKQATTRWEGRSNMGTARRNHSN